MKPSYTILCILGMMVVSSCEGFLDEPQTSQLSLSQFWSSPNDATLGVAAIYDAAQTVFEQNYWSWGELRADNFVKNDRPSTDNQQIADNGLTPNTAGGDWSDMYTAIATANVAIRQIPDIPAFVGQADLLAQALTLRALFYFYAVRIWGDVPKIVEPIEGLNQELNRPKSPSSEIFNDIILPDLEQAERLISTERSLSFISRGSVLALKAHVYMWPGSHQDYTTARDVITQLEGLGYSLETTQDGWTDIFRGSQTSDEIVFALAWSFNEDGGNGGIGAFLSATPNFLPSESLEQKWESTIPGDFRIMTTASFDVEIIDEAETPYLRILTKYSGRFENRNVQGSWGVTNDKDIIFYRLSGLLLLKAEAENNLDNATAALALVNRVRTARGLASVDESITDQSAIRDIILNDRQFELMGEGHRYWDLVRNDVVLDVMRPINGMDDPGKILWPISQNVLNRNANIIQNDSY